MVAMASVPPAASAAASVAAGSQQTFNACCAPRFSFCPGASSVGAGAWLSLRLMKKESVAARMPKILCQASKEETVESATKDQTQALELFAELMRADDVRAVAQEHVASLSEEFFKVASTYLDSARKAGNVEAFTKLETTLKTALSVKESSLRPETRLLNQLLRQKDTGELSRVLQSNAEYLQPGGYFIELLKRVTADVESQTGNRNRMQLLSQLHLINKEVNELNKAASETEGL